MKFDKHSFKKISVLAFGLLLLISLFQGDFLQKQRVEAANSYKIVGYYPSWGAYDRDYQVSHMDPTKVTHINYAFADICWDGKHGNPDPESPNPQTWSCQDETGVINAPNGTIVLGDPWIDVEKSFPGDTWDEPIKGNLKQLLKLKDINPDLKTIISVGGWSWSNKFSDVAADPTTRDTFADSAVDFIRKYGFDGVDLDWEYPVEGGLSGNSVRPEDKQNHTLLLQAVRDKLDIAELEDDKEYLLTIASGAGPVYAENNELENIANIVDWINIMTYDFNGGWQTVSAHNSPLYFDQEAENNDVPHADSFNVDAGVQGHLDAGVPANKIVLGTPFYGRGWGGCVDNNNGQYQDCSGVSNVGTWEDGVFDFSDLEANYINKNGYTRYWNDVAKVPYLYNPSNGNFISYDDEESFDHKISFIKSKGLSGAMFWEFSSDRNEVLLNKLASELDGPIIIDDEAPSEPTNVTANDITSKSVRLLWDASTDNVGVKDYVISYGSETITVTDTEVIITGLSPESTYNFTVQARDAAGNVSTPSEELTITTEESSDTVPPTIPTDLEVTEVTDSEVTLTWTASTDNIGVVGYTITHDDESAFVEGTTATIKHLKPNTAYAFSVTAVDAEENHSPPASIEVTTLGESICKGLEWNEETTYNDGEKVAYKGKLYEAKWWTQGDTPDPENEWGVWEFVEDCGEEISTEADEEAPSVPDNLTVKNKSATTITLNWDAATDNVAVVGYDVYEGSSLVTSVTTTNAKISDLSADTTYSFTVVALDAAGNVSEASETLAVTTLEEDDSPAPKGDRRYVTYASTWNTSIYDLATDNIPNYITHLNLAFVRPDTAYEQGSFDFDQEVTGFEFVEGAATPNGQKKFSQEEKADLIDQIDALKSRGTEVWLSVGGWSYSQGTQWDDFNAKNIVDLAIDLNASGIDIDWESSGSNCNKESANQFSCSQDSEVAEIITSLHDEINSREDKIGISIAGWSTGAYYVKDTPFEEGKVQWGSPYGGTMYNLVKLHGDKLDFINLMSYDGGVYYDPREGYESYRAIYDGPINVGLQISPEGAGGAVLKLHAEPGTAYDAEVLDGNNSDASQYYNVETLVDYIKHKGQADDGFMLWQLWKQRVHSPAPEGVATENSAGQYICENLPLAGDCSQTIPTLPKLTP